MAALCLSPQDSKAPIVIAFRGTKTGGDVISDLRLSVLGVVEKKFRDDAFNFYKKIREEHPGREIILTGHSLGGHLAQYVATKAYNTDEELRANPVIQVRTFNTAPVSTTHSSVFNDHPNLLPQFVNYRLSSDVVSDLPVQHYYGNTFVFPCSKGALSSHAMGPVLEFLPRETLKLRVGSSDKTQQHNSLAELVSGVMNSYQCRVEGQYFSHFRAGSKNLEKMRAILPDVIQDINDRKYNEAIQKLESLKGQLDGKVSTQFINALIKRAETVKESAAVNKPGVDSSALRTDSSAITAQRELKRSLRDMKEDHEEIAEDNSQRNRI